MTTRLETLGGLRAFRDGDELFALPGRRVQCALLVYLAVERRATRDSVMALLWPEKETERARRSLNNTAYELRRLLGDDWVSSHGDLLAVSASVVTDVGLLQAAVDEGRLDEAARLDGGAFLEGCYLAHSVDFEQWVDRQRARVGQLQQRVRREQVKALAGSGDPEPALRAARTWVDRTPLDDEACYWLIRLLAETGHTAEALRRYERFRFDLLGAFGVEPQEAVRDLVGRIRAGEVSGLATDAHEPAERGTLTRPPEEDREGAHPVDGGQKVAPPPSGTRAEAVARASAAPTESPRQIDPEEPAVVGLHPDRIWRPAGGWARKLATALSLYAVPAAGALQVIDYLIDYVGLPRSFFPAAFVLILGGVPIVAVTAFLESQPVARRDVRGLRFLVARWFRWKNAALGAIAATAAWTAAVIGWLLVAPSTSLDPSHVVVFPLATTTSIEDPAAGWDVALAIGGALEHTEPLKFVDGREWLDEPYRGRPESLTPAVARNVARSRGAGLYIDGAMRVEGDSLFVILRVHDVAGDSLLTRETVAGASSQWTAPRLALDGMRSILVRIVEPSRSADIAAIADRTTGSIALWLQGERAYRQSRFADALGFFERAVQDDSLHAFAAIKGAQAASWTTNTVAASELIARALRHEPSLPPKYRSLARGFRGYLDGDAAAATSAFRAALAVDPSWSEAAMALGETYYHLLPEDAADPDSITRFWFRRAAQSDPRFAPPLYHLAQIAVRMGDLDDAAETIQAWRAFQPDPVLLREVEASLNCVRRGARRHRWDAGPDAARPVLQAAHELAVGVAHPACASAAFRAVFDSELDSSLRWTALKGLYGLAVAAGRYQEADSLLRVGAETGFRAARTLYVFGVLAGAPFERQAAEAEAAARAAFGDAYESGLTRWRWLMGVWLARTGEIERLAVVQELLAAEAVSEGDREKEMLGRALAGHLAAARGDTTAAIGILDDLRATGPGGFLSFEESEPLAPERLLLAELLEARGQHERAYRVASLLDHPAPGIYPLFVARSLRIRMLAARGLEDDSRVRAVEARLTALGRGGSGESVARR
jgi:DNA-binding SARP family transcriptional activator